MIMIIINRSCFSAVVPRPCAADVEPRRCCRGEGWDEVTLVNNYPVAGRCQKPINRPGHHSTTLRRPKRLKMNMYAYITTVFFSSQSFFSPTMMYASVSKRRVVSPSLRRLSSCVCLWVSFFSSAHYMVIIIIRPLKGVERKKKRARAPTHTALGATR